jgi:hypothetical protein
MIVKVMPKDVSSSVHANANNVNSARCYAICIAACCRSAFAHTGPCGMAPLTPNPLLCCRCWRLTARGSMYINSMDPPGATLTSSPPRLPPPGQHARPQTTNQRQCTSRVSGGLSAAIQAQIGAGRVPTNNYTDAGLGQAGADGTDRIICSHESDMTSDSVGRLWFCAASEAGGNCSERDCELEPNGARRQRSRRGRRRQQSALAAPRGVLQSIYQPHMLVECLYSVHVFVSACSFGWLLTDRHRPI